MIRKPSRQDATRLACGTLVAAASVFTAGVGFASSANAAATSVTATPAQSNYAVGATATINVTTVGTPTTQPLLLDVTSGPDAIATNVGKACTTNSTTSYTCTFVNTKGSGTDSIRVYDDADKTGSFTTGDVAGTTSVTFGDQPTAISLTASSATVTANNPETYTITAKDQNGNPSVGSQVNVSFTETTSSATSPLAFSDGTAGTTTDTASGSSYVHTLSAAVTIGSNGTAKVSVTSTTAGSVTVKASNADGTVSQTATYTVTGGNSGNAAVSSLSVSPVTSTSAVGGSVAYTVTAKDSSGNPVGGATVSYQVTSGPDANTNAFNTCGTTSNTAGTATCTITNAKGAGSDSITFYVNETSQATVTPGPDSGEPQTVATASFTAQPLYDSITVTCPDSRVTSSAPAGTANDDCVVPVGTASTTFTVTVKNKNGQGVETAVSGALVNLSVSSGTATLSATTVTTGADGTATVKATPSATTAGTTYTVRAIVGDGSSYIGSGSASATGTVTYEASTETNIVLTPTNQSRQVGGTASVTAKVTDQFGNPLAAKSLYFGVTGRNSKYAGPYNTDTSGSVTYTYTDSPSTANPAGGVDTVGAVDYSTDISSNSVTVNWVQSATIGQLTVNLNDNDASCVTSAQGGNTSDTSYISTSPTESICATVQNAAGDVLPGQTVTFTVDKGYVTTTDGNETNTAPTSTTVTVTTDSNGYARAYLGSTVTGTQTVTATAGGLSKTATVSYRSGYPATITLTPATATVTPGGTQKFVATAKDQFGNASQYYDLLFQQSGPGNIGGASSADVVTDANGVATVTLSVPTTASGSGSVTVLSGDYDSTPATATSTYTVGAPQAASISVDAGDAVTVRSLTTATAVVRDGAGNLLANQSVSFTVSGSQSTTGTATTDANGKASFLYRAEHAGGAKVTATVTGTSVSGSDTVTFARQPVNVTLKLTSTSKGKITLVASAKPVTGADIGATMGFYQSTSRGYVGPARATIATSGMATLTLSRTSGSTVTFYATVIGDNDVTATPSAPVSVRVK